MKIAPVQIFKNFFQIKAMTVGRSNLLAPAHLTNEVCLGAQAAPTDVSAIALRATSIYWLAVKFGQQDVGNCLQHAFWRTLQQVRNSRQHSSLAQPYVVVDIGEREELDRKFRHRSARPQLAVTFLENGLDPVRHFEF